MSTGSRWLVGLVSLGILVASGFLLLHSGLYGLTFFVLSPVMLGGLASWVMRPASGKGAAGVGALAVAAGLLMFFLAGWEGAICIVMALPLALPLGALGGWMCYRTEGSKGATRGGIAMLLLLPPAGITWDTQVSPPVFEVRTAIEIAATPEQVWKHIVTFSELPEPQEWFFRAGLAFPKLSRIEGSGVGATRYCEFSTGPVVEPIEVWDEPRVLQFRVTETPAPMRELSFYKEVLPKHLHG